MDLDCINNDSEDSFNSVISEAIEITMRHFSDPMAEINPMKIKDRIRFKKLISILRNKARETILNRLNNPDGNFNDLLDSIIEACKTDNGLDMELMIDDFLIFFIAGSDTAVNTLCSCLYFIEKYPAIRKKAQEEVYDVIGYKKGITNEDVLKLKYCGSIIKETLRINPPFSFIVRYNESAFKIGDLVIPENSNIFMSTYVSSRMESNFKDALEFNPERFMKDSDSIDTHVDRFAYYPFSLGPRSCIGQNFGQIEVTILLAKILQRFEFKLDHSELYENKPYRELVREAKYAFSAI